MRMLHKKLVIAAFVLTSVLVVPLAAHAFLGTVPVIDWTAVTRIGHQIGISVETLNTLGLYVQQYNRVNAGIQEGVALVRGKHLRGVLNQAVGSEFPEFQQLQRDFRDVLADPSTIRQDLENSYGLASGDFPLIRKRRIDAADATATLGLIDASRMERVSQEQELDADDIEARAANASPGGAAKLAAAANGALLRSQAYQHRLLARLMRLQALAIARENSIEKEQEQVRQEQVTAVADMVGDVRLSYGIGERVEH